MRTNKKGNAGLASHKASGTNKAENRPDHNLNFRMMPASKQQLAERGIDFPTVAAQAGKPEADPFDLLCHLAFNAPVLTRR